MLAYREVVVVLAFCEEGDCRRWLGTETVMWNRISISISSKRNFLSSLIINNPEITNGCSLISLLVAFTSLVSSSLTTTFTVRFSIAFYGGEGVSVAFILVILIFLKWLGLGYQIDFFFVTDWKGQETFFWDEVVEVEMM